MSFLFCNKYYSCNVFCICFTCNVSYEFNLFFFVLFFPLFFKTSLLILSVFVFLFYCLLCYVCMQNFLLCYVVYVLLNVFLFCPLSLSFLFISCILFVIPLSFYIFSFVLNFSFYFFLFQTKNFHLPLFFFLVPLKLNLMSLSIYHTLSHSLLSDAFIITSIFPKMFLFWFSRVFGYLYPQTFFVPPHIFPLNLLAIHVFLVVHSSYLLLWFSISLPWILVRLRVGKSSHIPLSRRKKSHYLK